MKTLTKTTTVASVDDLSITATRHFDAPRELVWEAWTKPENIRRWWICDGMSMPVCTSDLRVGGEYRFGAVMADGTECPMKGTYLELDPPARLVCTQIYDVSPYDQLVATVTVTLTAKDGGTELSSRIVFPDRASFEGAAASGMEEGMGIALDRLASVVAEGFA